MAYIDDEVAVPNITADGNVVFETEQLVLAFAKRAIWQLFTSHKNESYKGKLWGVIPYSIKVEKIEPILTRFLGPNPYA